MPALPAASSSNAHHGGTQTCAQHCSHICLLALHSPATHPCVSLLLLLSLLSPAAAAVNVEALAAYLKERRQLGNLYLVRRRLHAMHRVPPRLPGLAPCNGRQERDPSLLLHPPGGYPSRLPPFSSRMGPLAHPPCLLGTRHLPISAISLPHPCPLPHLSALPCHCAPGLHEEWRGADRQAVEVVRA